MSKTYTLKNMKFSPDFFEDEVREGFFVSSEMKHYWAAQLTVLKEIDSICRKHNIPWFAFYGTLLGAMRHQGFIPWDDDIDICMLRHDYVRFFEYAKELPKSYCALSIEVSDEYRMGIGRIINSHKINWSNEHLRLFHNSPYSVGIDIFPLDGISENESLEAERDNKLKHIAEAISYIKDGKLASEGCKFLLSLIERENNIVLCRNNTIVHELNLLTTRLYSLFSSESSSKVGFIHEYYYKHTCYPKNFFEKMPLVLFENIYIPAPYQSEKILEIDYGNWQIPLRGTSDHTYPLYREQEQEYRQRFGKNLLRYTLTKELLEQRKRSIPLIKKLQKMVNTLLETHIHINNMFKTGQSITACSLLETAQQVAISIGTLIEERLSKNSGIIRALEEYCEMIYAFSLNWSTESKSLLDEKLFAISIQLKSMPKHAKREILFLPCKAAWWSTMSPILEQMSHDDSNNINILPIPYYTLSSENGEYIMRDDSLQFPNNITVCTTNEYDITAKLPDIIIIQFPYDEYSREIKIPEMFYSKNLLQYTDELIYSPCFQVEDPVSPNDVISQSLLPFIETPAVLYSDKIILNSDKMRTLYVNTLSKLTGSDTIDYWTNKIKTI